MGGAPRTVGDWFVATGHAVVDSIHQTRWGRTPVEVSRAFVRGFRDGRIEARLREEADAARQAFDAERARLRAGQRSSVRVKPIIAWYDAWVGVFVDAPKRRIYILPLPFIGFQIDFEDPKFEAAKASRPSKPAPERCDFFLLKDEFAEDEEQIMFKPFEYVWAEAKAQNEARAQRDEFPSLLGVYGVVNYGAPDPEEEVHDE